MRPPIRTRFDLVWKLSNRDGVFLTLLDLWQVPRIKDIVNIEGNPYRVINVGWSLPTKEERHEDSPTQYAFVDVQKASEFKVLLGDREY